MNWWKQYWIFNWSTVLSVAKIPSWTKWTVSLWIQKLNTSDSTIFCQNLNTANSNNYVEVNVSWTRFQRYDPQSGEYNWTYTFTTWAWYNVIISSNWSQLELTINGVSQWTKNYSYWFNRFSTNQLCLWWLIRSTQSYALLNWYLSKVILEDRTRTSQEKLDYFNKTKKHYWY